jgi:hypothetical protein
MMEVPEKDFRLINAVNATHKDRQGTAITAAYDGGDVAQAVSPLRKRGRPQDSRDGRFYHHCYLKSDP